MSCFPNGISIFCIICIDIVELLVFGRWNKQCTFLYLISGVVSLKFRHTEILCSCGSHMMRSSIVDQSYRVADFLCCKKHNIKLQLTQFALTIPFL